MPRLRVSAARLLRALPALALAGAVALPSACSSAAGDGPTAPPPTNTAPPPSTPTTPEPAPPTPPPPGPAAGVVRGSVVDAGGRPLAGVQVFADNTLYYNTNAVGVTDAQGRYQLDVREPIGTWRMGARLMRTYHGRLYQFDLHPDNADPFPGAGGAVRNFDWRLSGPTPEGTRYGARAYVYVNASPDRSLHPAYAEVEVTLTPDGPLADGSVGTPMTVRLETFRVEDVPLGRYAVTARYAPAAGAPRAMAVRVRDTGAYAPSVVVDWPADSDGRLRVLELEVRVP